MTCFQLFRILFWAPRPAQNSRMCGIDSTKLAHNKLRAFLNDNDCDVLMQHLTFCYNTSPHGAFDNKFTPFELVFARKCNFPYDLLTKIQPLYNYENYVKVTQRTLQIAYEKASKLIERMKLNTKKFYDQSAGRRTPHAH